MWTRVQSHRGRPSALQLEADPEVGQRPEGIAVLVLLSEPLRSPPCDLYHQLPMLLEDPDGLDRSLVLGSGVGVLQALGAQEPIPLGFDDLFVPQGRRVGRLRPRYLDAEDDLGHVEGQHVGRLLDDAPRVGEHHHG